MLPNQFLFELSKMFESGRQTNKTIRITLKRYDGRTTRNPRKPQDKPRMKPKQQQKKQQQQQQPEQKSPPSESKCLIRASSGSKKIRVEVGQKDVQFQQSYSNLIKGNIVGLKKK
uniref:Signal recognition particle 14 kDa protein n=1 Tax=Aceria tosichella TaxID=561515 RepID=A0A6G1SQF5_9ACAR